jgi:hypothetical protein
MRRAVAPLRHTSSWCGTYLSTGASFTLFNYRSGYRLGMSWFSQVSPDECRDRNFERGSGRFFPRSTRFVMRNCQMLPQHLCGETEENHDNSQSL